MRSRNGLLVGGLAALLAAAPGWAAEPRSFRGVIDSEAGLVRDEADVLQAVAGTLRSAGRPGASPFSQVGDASFGSFSVRSVAPDRDLRTHPFRLLLDTDGGRLVALAERVDRIWRVDPLSGRPLRPDAPEAASCPTGTEPGCLAPAVFPVPPGPQQEFPRAPLSAFDVPPFDERLLHLYCERSAGIFGAVPFPCGVNPATEGVAPLGIAFTSPLAGHKNVLFGLLDSTAIARDGALGAQARLASALVDLNGDGAVDGVSDLPLIRIFDDADICARALADPANAAFANVLADCALSGNDPDGPDAIAEGLIHVDPVINGLISAGLHGRLSDPGEALLGCGPFYGPLCDVEGPDFRVASAAFLLQAWNEGPLEDAGIAQPGTAGSPVGPPCPREAGAAVVELPGCGVQLTDSTDGAVDSPGWNRLVDGTSPSSDEAEASALAEGDTTSILRHPFACVVPPVVVSPDGSVFFNLGAVGMTPAQRGCQRWASEGAALSWNFLITLAALSGPDVVVESEILESNPGFPIADPALGTTPASQIPIADPDNCEASFFLDGADILVSVGECYKPPQADQLDVTDLFRSAGCSFLRPTLCRKVREVLSLVVTELPDDPNSEPRRRWTWETGVSGVVVEAAGDLSEYFGGTLHAFGPVEPGGDEGVAAANLLLLPSECNDGRDNDGDERVDFPADDACRSAFWNSETPCGLGFELALVVPVLRWARRKRRTRA